MTVYKSEYKTPPFLRAIIKITDNQDGIAVETNSTNIINKHEEVTVETKIENALNKYKEVTVKTDFEKYQDSSKSFPELFEDKDLLIKYSDIIMTKEAATAFSKKCFKLENLRFSQNRGKKLNDWYKENKIKEKEFSETGMRYRLQEQEDFWKEQVVIDDKTEEIADEIIQLGLYKRIINSLYKQAKRKKVDFVDRDKLVGFLNQLMRSKDPIAPNKIAYTHKESDNEESIHSLEPDKAPIGSNLDEILEEDLAPRGTHSNYSNNIQTKEVPITNIQRIQPQKKQQTNGKTSEDKVLEAIDNLNYPLPKEIKKYFRRENIEVRNLQVVLKRLKDKGRIIQPGGKSTGYGRPGENTEQIPKPPTQEVKLTKKHQLSLI